MRKTIKLLLILLCFIYHLSLNSQNYRDIFYKKINISNDMALSYCDSLITSTQKNIKAFAYGGKGFILSRKSNYKEAEELFKKAQITLNKMRDSKIKREDKIYILNFYCLYLIKIHNLEEANLKINEGLVLSKELNNLEMQIKFNRLLGRCYSLLGLGKKGLKISSNTIKTIKNLKPKLSKPFYNENLLYAYLNTSNRVFAFFLQDSIKNKVYLDSCEYYVLEAKKHINKSNFNPNLEQNLQILGLSGTLFFFKKEYKKAIPYFEKILAKSELNNLKKTSYQIKFRLAECYFFLKQFKMAKKLFDSLNERDLKKYNLLKNRVIINYYYAEICRNFGDIENTFKYSQLYNSQLDAFYKNNSDLKISIFTDNELREKKDLRKTKCHEKYGQILKFIFNTFWSIYMYYDIPYFFLY
ncbi:tetratricopeptide repeat protein [Tenacibaculum sp. nBUS_03]|uniref:tetratricopeptide repeat protein n=1 Tax=Tenacibaculum sp. nBUS_03 TaxID=3395320 RepID=UPI003EBB59DE